MYRPTIRMDDAFKEWLEQVAKETGFNVNQLIRLAIFSAPFSAVFTAQLQKASETDVSLSPPPWDRLSDGGPWRWKEWKREEKGVDVYAESEQEGTEIVIESVRNVEPGEPERESDVRNAASSERREREVPEPPKTFTQNYGNPKGIGVRVNGNQVSSTAR
ncbi:hypothetical protein [Salipaludibacillus sp. CF4.18]|uniref:hypothetical protein n=1 Tax=Salipaludibacillus sp. CF4.18 TaxID=3373081 RepID=UPI003EE7BC8A